MSKSPSFQARLSPQGKSISPQEKEQFYTKVREEFDLKLREDGQEDGQEDGFDFSKMYQFVSDIFSEENKYNAKHAQPSSPGYLRYTHTSIDTRNLTHELIMKWISFEKNSITTKEFLLLLKESGDLLSYLGPELGWQFDKVFEAWYRGEDKTPPEMFVEVYGAEKRDDDKFKSRIAKSMEVSFDEAVKFINKYLSSLSSEDFLPNELVITQFFESDKFSFEEKLRLAQELRKSLVPDEKEVRLLQMAGQSFDPEKKYYRQERKVEVVSGAFYNSWAKKIDDEDASFEECKRICQALDSISPMYVWLQKNKKNISLDQFKEISKNPEIVALSPDSRFLLYYYLQNRSSPKSLQSLLPLQDVMDGSDIFSAFIYLDENPDYRRKAVKEAFALGLMTVAKVYNAQAATYPMESLEYICAYICSNDEQRNRFLDYYIGLVLTIRGPDPDYLRHHSDDAELDFLKKLISSFDLDENAQAVTHKILQHNLLKIESFPYICEDRAKRKYPSLFKILENDPGPAALNPDAVSNFQNDDDAREVVDFVISHYDAEYKGMNFFRLFGYLDIFLRSTEDALYAFDVMLPKDYTARIREKIASSQVSLISDERSYISREEANAIAVACGQVLILPRLFQLANYLSICIDIKPYNPQSVRINFKDSANSRESTEDAKSAEDLINKKFVGLLSQDPSGKSEQELDALSDEVVAFFSQLLQQPDLAELLNAQDEQEQEAQAALPEDDRLPVVLTKTKIRDLFFTNKREFVEIFSREGGIELFKNYVFPTLDHGCVYNIHNQMLLAIYQSLIEDPAQKVLMVNFAKKIFQDINSLNNGFLEHANPLGGHSVASGFFSLLGLRKEIAERFKSGDFSASNFLVEHHLTKEERQDLRELRKYEKPVHDDENAPSFFDLEPEGSPKKLQLQEIMQKEREINELYDEVFEKDLMSEDISVKKRFGIVEERKINLASAMVMDDFVRQNWEELQDALEGSLEYRDLERFITFYMKYREAFVEAFMDNSQESLQAMASPISSFQAAAPTKIPTSEQASQLHAGQKDNLEIG